MYLPQKDSQGTRWSLDWAVTGISYRDALAYCTWLSKKGTSYRLPSDDEWEKAARGGDKRIFPWGDDFDPTFCHMNASKKDLKENEKAIYSINDRYDNALFLGSKMSRGNY